MKAETALHPLLVQTAQAHGFPLAGAVDLELAREAIAPHVARYDDWVSKGYAGAMNYLVRGRDRRADPRIVMPETQSVFCVLSPYPKRPGGETSPEKGPRYARYIHGKDYHDEVAARLEAVMAEVATKWKSISDAGNERSAGEALKWKVCVDTSAVLERSWAALAGLGWIGKNTLLIHPQYGSYFFVGVVLIDQPTGQGPRPLPDYCGNCTRCLKACPTQAITEPHTVDSNRCISYWTLEKRGTLEIAESDKSKIGTWIAGCDLCQEVCPFNTKPVKRENEAPPAQAAVSAEYLKDWESLLRETPDEYKARIQDSALGRVKPAQFSRNLAITLGNAAESLENETDREYFTQKLLPLVKMRLESETDEVAKLEWRRCAESFSRLSTTHSPKQMA